MHSKGISHRDIKVENILVGGTKETPIFKIGVSGSSSKDYFLDYKKAQKAEIFRKIEEFEGQTTHMYRPPEMLDRYAGY